MLFEVGLGLPFAGDVSLTCFLCPSLRISAVLLRPSTFTCVTRHLNLTIALSNDSTSLKADRHIFLLAAYLF